MIVITGHRGFLGNAIAGYLGYRGLPWRGLESDLRNPFPDVRQGETVVHCAYPSTDGIGSMETMSADIVTDGLKIDMNVIQACALQKVRHLVCFGSVCAYPEAAAFPADEEQLWNGYPEAINAPYGNAKRMQLELLRAYHRQYGLRSSHLILGNVYGPGDRSGHVIPATIRKVLAAQKAGDDGIDVWGDGSASRDFLYVDDAAAAVRNAILLEPTGVEVLNISSGREMLIERMVQEVMMACRFVGTIRWNKSKPNGQPRRWFDTTKAVERLDWMARTSFRDGLERTIGWIKEHDGY